MKTLKILCVFFALLTVYAYFHADLKKERKIFLDENYIDYTLPSMFTGPMSLEFKGVASDFLLIKFMSFVGKAVAKEEAFDDQKHKYMVKTLDTVTDLDPYFWEAYLFSQMFLSWGNGKYNDANKLLEKGQKHSPDDYRYPYYIGFNYYYFLNDNINGAKYLMEASKLNGAPYYTASLAARLSTYSSQHRVAIVFLKGMLKQTTNKRALKEFPVRIKTLEIMDDLEYKIKDYINIHKKQPGSLDALISAGIIDSIPDDPYGGEFILRENGSVYTTSNMLSVKKSGN